MSDEAKALWCELTLTAEYERFTLPLLFASDGVFVEYYNTLESRLGEVDLAAATGQNTNVRNVATAISELRQKNTQAKHDRASGYWRECLESLRQCVQLRLAIFGNEHFQYTSARVHYACTLLNFASFFLRESSATGIAAQKEAMLVRSYEVFRHLETEAKDLIPPPMRWSVTLMLQSNYASYFYKRRKYNATSQRTSKALGAWEKQNAATRADDALHIGLQLRDASARVFCGEHESAIPVLKRLLGDIQRLQQQQQQQQQSQEDEDAVEPAPPPKLIGDDTEDDHINNTNTNNNNTALVPVANNSPSSSVGNVVNGMLVVSQLLLPPSTSESSSPAPPTGAALLDYYQLLARHNLAVAYVGTRRYTQALSHTSTVMQMIADGMPTYTPHVANTTAKLHALCSKMTSESTYAAYRMKASEHRGEDLSHNKTFLNSTLKMAPTDAVVEMQRQLDMRQEIIRQRKQQLRDTADKCLPNQLTAQVYMPTTCNRHPPSKPDLRSHVTKTSSSTRVSSYQQLVEDYAMEIDRYKQFRVTEKVNRLHSPPRSSRGSARVPHPPHLEPPPSSSMSSRTPKSAATDSTADPSKKNPATTTSDTAAAKSPPAEVTDVKPEPSKGPESDGGPADNNNDRVSSAGITKSEKEAPKSPQQPQDVEDGTATPPPEEKVITAEERKDVSPPPPPAKRSPTPPSRSVSSSSRLDESAATKDSRIEQPAAAEGSRRSPSPFSSSSTSSAPPAAPVAAPAPGSPSSTPPSSASSTPVAAAQPQRPLSPASSSDDDSRKAASPPPTTDDVAVVEKPDVAATASEPNKDKDDVLEEEGEKDVGRTAEESTQPNATATTTTTNDDAAYTSDFSAVSPIAAIKDKEDTTANTNNNEDTSAGALAAPRALSDTDSDAAPVAKKFNDSDFSFSDSDSDSEANSSKATPKKQTTTKEAEKSAPPTKLDTDALQDTNTTAATTNNSNNNNLTAAAAASPQYSDKFDSDTEDTE